MMKRILSLLLCLVMVLSMVPAQAIAQETGEESLELIPEAESVEAETAPAEEIPISTEVVTEPIEETTVPTEVVTEPVEETTVPTEVVTEPAEETSEPTAAEEVVAETTGSDVAMGAVVSGTCGENLTWTYADGVLSIDGEGNMDNFGSSAYVPWYNYRTAITGIVIAEGVSSIGKCAFIDFWNLRSISIPDTVTSIGKSAFSYCEKLEQIWIPKGVTIIEEYAFHSCESLISLMIPDGVTKIGNRAFYGCSSLKSITIPDSVTAVGPFAFAYCVSLSDITIPFGTIDIGDSAFEDCSSLKDIVLPNSVTSVGERAFQNCKNLTSVTISEGMTTLKSMLFRKCKNLTNITIPRSVTSIKSYAFEGCDKLTDVYYAGTENEWHAINKFIPYGNGPLLGVVVHYNDEIPNRPDGSIEKIPIGAQYFSGSYYHIYSLNGYSWLSAKDYCEELGGHLATITNAEEQAFVEMLSGGNKNLWIGGYRDDAFNWYWVTGEEWEYTNWGNNQPDNSSNVVSNENCLAIWPKQWNDLNENNTMEQIGFICEWDGFSDSDQDEIAIIGDVRYFSTWNITEKTAYFGPDDMTGSQVTADSDASLLENIADYVGQFVLVEASRGEENSREILISMKPVETKTGAVTSADASYIVISGSSYTMPKNLEDVKSYVNQNVVYHLYEGKIVGIEILQTLEGTLTSWNKPSGTVNIKKTASDELATLYYLSPLADEDTLVFLGETGLRDTDVVYLADRNNLLYQIKRVGFNPEKDAWCFPNHWDGFGYDDRSYRIPDERYEEVFGASYVASARVSSKKVFDSMIPEWRGNCYGMSVTSVLFYMELLNWNEYGGNEFACINDYHTAIGNIGKKPVYALSEKYSEITKLIEKYQILQRNDNVGYQSVNSTVNKLNPNYYENDSTDLYENLEACYIHNPSGNYITTVLEKIIQSDSPLIVAIMGNGGHGLVTRTDKQPEKVSEDIWRVYVYDPNHPYFSGNYSGTLADCYSNGTDLYIEFHKGLNQWRYNGSVNGSIESDYWGSDENWNLLTYTKKDNDDNVLEYGPEYCYVFSIHDSGIPLKFDGTEKWTHFTNMPGFVPDGYVDIYTENGILVCSVKNGIPTYLGDGVEYHPFIGAEADTEHSIRGKILIPHDRFIAEYFEANDISFIGDKNVINIASSGKATISISVSDGTIEILSNEDSKILTQITNVYSNSEYTSIVADGTAKQGDNIMLCLKEDKFNAKYDGVGSVEITTDNNATPDSRVLGMLNSETPSIEIDDVRETPEEYPVYTYGQNVQIKLIEPWGIRANAKTSTSAGVVDYDSLYDYGVYFIRKSALDRTGLTQSTITVADILNDTDARKMTKADGVTVSSGYLSAIYDSDIYTYELDDSVFVMFYFVTEEGADPIYVPVRERNLKTLAQQRMNDAASFPNDLERDVYKKMVTLEADVTDYRSDFTSLSTPEMQKAPTLAQYPLGAQAAGNKYTYGQNAQIKLIEPWGLKANVKVSYNGSVIDYSTVEEYGMVVLADNSRAYTDAAEILQNENAYVFSSKNGDASISGQYISATYSKDIYTYQLDTDIYVFGYVKDSDGYHYGPVRNRNVHTLMEARKNDVANFPNVKERTVYADMIDLYTAITAYREDYFKN